MAELPDKRYKVSPYQNAIAAIMWNTSPRMSAKIDAGNGKTFLVVKSIKLATADSMKSIVLITNEMLLQQMNQYIDLFCK